MSGVGGPDKIYMTYSDMNGGINFLRRKFIGQQLNIVTLYRGGLPLGVALSNQMSAPLSILDYQRLDGDSIEVSWMKNIIDKSKPILLVDDICDKGITIKKSVDFLKNEGYENIIVYTLWGNKNNHPEEYLYSFTHEGEWVEFPWEYI